MAWQDTLAIMEFCETHGRLPEPGEETLGVLADARVARERAMAERARADWPMPPTLPPDVEALADERAEALELVESRMNPQSREAVRRRRRFHGS